MARTQSLYLDTQEEDKQNRIIQLEEELIKQRQEAEIKETKMREMEEARKAAAVRSHHRRRRPSLD